LFREQHVALVCQLHSFSEQLVPWKHQITPIRLINHFSLIPFLLNRLPACNWIYGPSSGNVWQLVRKSFRYEWKRNFLYFFNLEIFNEQPDQLRIISDQRELLNCTERFAFFIDRFLDWKLNLVDGQSDLAEGLDLLEWQDEVIEFGEDDFVDFSEGGTWNYHSETWVINWVGDDNLESWQLLNRDQSKLQEFFEKDCWKTL
jgi:hypothetical protein